VQRTPRENYMFADPHEGPEMMDYFVWAIRGGNRAAMVVDTGFGEAAAKARKRTLLRSPADGLKLLGIDAATVPEVVITHLHYDHAGNLHLFPKATFHLQDDEMAFATGRYMRHPVLRHGYDIEDVVQMVRNVYAERVRFHKAEVELAPGITLHPVPGHTAGLQVVRVHTARGWVVLASDATHYFANMEKRNPFPTVFDVGKMLEGYDMLKRLADSPDHIVPGHDPKVLAIYPKVPGADDVVALHEKPSK
jgi:glyoxylase-like metal-dependent hydrolase (beta-lactamase superfamily II)